jgi:hypothetical protein
MGFSWLGCQFRGNSCIGRRNVGGRLYKTAHYDDEEAVPFACGADVWGADGWSPVEAVAAVSVGTSGDDLRVNDDVSVSSSGIVANFFKTCLRAGRRMGLLGEGQWMVLSAESLTTYLKKWFMPLS